MKEPDPPTQTRDGPVEDAESVMGRDVERFYYAVQYRIPSLNMPQYNNQIMLQARQGIAGLHDESMHWTLASIIGHLIHRDTPRSA